MEKLIIVLGIGFSLLSCNSSVQQTPKEDTVVRQKADTVAVTGDNIVKSEAPDAAGKADQGYSLSRHNNGMAQSPINIISSDATDDHGPAFHVKFQTDIVAAENLGHTVQVDFRDGSSCLAGGSQYATKQFHFHTPSEHMIDGMTFPLEMHIVNMLKDSNEKTKPSYLVIGVLFKMGKENKFIKEFLHDVPKEDGEKDSIQKGTVNFADLSSQFQDNSKNSWFSYDGSLTTPPFTERVHWIVLKRILEASPDQIMDLEKLEGNNARHIQALYDRKVVSH